MNTYDEDLEDQMAAECERDHNDRPDAECRHCDYRRTRQGCWGCNAVFEDGEWQNEPTSLPCDHVGMLTDDWGRELVCEVVTCADLVETAGRTRCDFHQRWADADEADRIYQALVASPAPVTLEVVR